MTRLTVPPTRRRILALASGGGHFQQLMKLRPAFGDHNVHYMTTLAGLPEKFGITQATIIPECNAKTPLRAVGCAVAVGWRVFYFRPHVVVTTGALPGLIAVALGRLVGARAIWVDSIANAETLSASGHKARRIVDLCISQWPAVAESEKVQYHGSIL